jgi:hypothetical protein
MGRSAFIVRRESRYLFRTRWPRFRVHRKVGSERHLQVGSGIPSGRHEEVRPLTLKRRRSISTKLSKTPIKLTFQQAEQHSVEAVLHLGVTPGTQNVQKTGPVFCKPPIGQTGRHEQALFDRPAARACDRASLFPRTNWPAASLS